MALTDKQQAFVREYLVDLNATAAAQRAGYPHPNKQGPRMLVNAGIRAAIDDAMFDRAERVQVKADDVLRELKAIAFSDIGDIIDYTGDEPALKPAWHIPKRARRTISSIKVKRVRVRGSDPPREVETQEFKQWSKLDALDKLMKHLGLLKEPALLEAFLGTLPGPVADRIRGRLAELIRGGSSQPSTNGTNGHGG